MTSESVAQHRDRAAERGPVSVAIVTVSDTRTPETDVNARYLRERLAECGHRLAFYRIIKDEPDQVEEALDACLSSAAQAVLFNGGTGMARRDTTFDVLSRKLEKTLPGFGEIFRMLSYEQVGAAAMLSRATAGVYQGMIVVSTPGSPAAVKLAWEKLIAPEISHMAYELVK
ncbi:MAG: molybdenum cofactor biosynthesis protein MoaB [candidate division Zixibacteria bacterium]|nr:molybdenum cofactor biosynthesis protein MoaB [candidate division Zixibacteria bacterium]